MIKQNLSKIKQINLRDVFEKEDRDFTPQYIDTELT